MTTTTTVVRAEDLDQVTQYYQNPESATGDYLNSVKAGMISGLVLKGDDVTRLSVAIIATNESTLTSERSDDVIIDADTDKAVRRPYRGIGIKRETFASISVVKDKTSFSKSRLKNSSATGDTAFTSNFLVNSIAESRQEKHQPVSTFGKDYVYFFGEQPRQVTLNCTLLNSDNFRWEEEWWYNYEESFRGTRLASRSEELRIRLDESIIYGYMITCSTNKDSNNPHVVTLSFTVHVTEIVSTRESKIGSNRIDGSTEGFGYVDLNVHDPGVAGAPTITIGKDSAAVREYNLKQYISKDSGWLSRLRNGIQDFGAALSNVGQDVVDFMYGRNIVLPADIAYNEFTSGNPQFAEGTDAHNILFADGTDLSKTAAKRYGKSLSKFASEGASVVVTPSNSTGFYTDNYDEYPFFSVTSVSAVETLTAGASFTEQVADFVAAELRIDKGSLLAGDDMILDNPENRFLSGLRSAAGAATFGIFQTGTATADSNSRSRSSEDSSSESYPNEESTIAASSN